MPGLEELMEAERRLVAAVEAAQAQVDHAAAHAGAVA